MAQHMLMITYLLFGFAAGLNLRAGRTNQTVLQSNGYDPVDVLCRLGKDTLPWCKNWVSCIRTKAAPGNDKAAVLKAWSPAKCKSICGVWPAMTQVAKHPAAPSFLNLRSTNDCVKSCEDFQSSLSSCVATIMFDHGKLPPKPQASKKKAAEICTKKDSPCRPELAIQYQECSRHRTEKVLDASHEIADDVAQRCKLAAAQMKDCEDCPQLHGQYQSEYVAYTGGCMDQLNSYWAATNHYEAGTYAVPLGTGCEVRPMAIKETVEMRAADQQSDQYAKAQAKAADKKEAVDKVKEKVEKLKVAAEKAAKKAAENKAAAEKAAADKKAAAEMKAAAEKAAAEAKKLKAAAEKKAAEVAKLKAAAEKAAAKAKKEEEEMKAAAKVAKKAVKKACADQMAGLPCGQQWAFVTDSKNNLLAIKKGPKTGSGKTEVHRLTAISNYKKFDLHTATALQLTDNNWDFVMDSKDNLLCILKGPKTGSGKTEVHRLSAASNYRSFNLHTGTGLQITGSNWAFTMDSQDRLVCVLKGPSGSKKTEVHRLTASSNYKKFDLHTATGLQYTATGLNGNARSWDFAMDSKDNLVCILKGPTSGSGKTEVHKLNGATNFKTFNLHTSTALHYSTKHWAFAMAGDDLIGVLKGTATGTCKTEVHKLSGASNYGTWALQTGTGLELSDPNSCSS